MKKIMQWIVDTWRYLLAGETTKPCSQLVSVPSGEVISDATQASEDLIIALINNERSKKGLKPLQKHMTVSTVAHKYAALMAQKNTLSHNLDGDIGGRLTEAGYQWLHAGENIGWNYHTPEEMVLGWMQSPGHRANILNRQYIHTGVGIKDNGRGPYYCQDFGTPVQKSA